MRVLYLSQGRKAEDHPGYHDAMQRLLREEKISFYNNLPYIGFAEEHGYEGLWDEIVRRARENEVDAVYFQYFHRKANKSPLRCIEALRRLPSRPTIAVSCGDAFSANWMWPRFPESFVECACLSDIVYMTQMGKAADKLVLEGVKNIVLLPHALCQIRFNAKQSCGFRDVCTPHDVVWVGSMQKFKPNIWNRVFWCGYNRKRMVRALTDKFHSRFGLFGRGWDNHPCWKGIVPFEDQQQAFRSGRIVVDAIPDPFGELYYTSDRPFFALASGVPVILFEKSGVDKIFRRNEHAYFVRGEGGLIATCDRLLKEDHEELQRKANETAKYICEKHTQYHRMEFAVATIRQYRKAKLEKRTAALPVLPFLLPEVDQVGESKRAIRAWVG